MNKSPSQSPISRFATPAVAALSLSMLQACATTHGQVKDALDATNDTSDITAESTEKVENDHLKDGDVHVGPRIAINPVNSTAKAMTNMRVHLFSGPIGSDYFQLVGGAGIGVGYDDNVIPYASVGGSFAVAKGPIKEGSSVSQGFYIEPTCEAGGDFNTQKDAHYPVVNCGVSLNGHFGPFAMTAAEVRYQNAVGEDSHAGQVVLGTGFGGAW